MSKVRKLMRDSKVAEVSTVSNEMTTLFSDLDLGSDLFLKSLFDEYRSLSESISTAIKRDQAESDLDERDKDRDTITRDIFFLVKGATHNPIPSINEAGVTIQAVLYKYGLSVVKKSYAIQSAHTRSLIDDLSTEEMEDSVGEIAGLEQLINRLNQVQDLFEEAVSAFDDAKSIEKNQASASKIKQEILKQVNEKIVVYLRAMAMANPDMFGEFVRRTAEIIDRNNVQVKKRYSSQKTQDNA